MQNPQNVNAPKFFYGHVLDMYVKKRGLADIGEVASWTSIVPCLNEGDYRCHITI